MRYRWLITSGAVGVQIDFPWAPGSRNIGLILAACCYKRRKRSGIRLEKADLSVRENGNPVLADAKQTFDSVRGTRQLNGITAGDEAGADFFVVQSTVTTARHVATEYTPMDLRELKKHLSIPLIVGNTVTYEACLELMQCGVDAMLIGVGPGASCTSREVLGLGVPQVTATADSAAARDFYYKRTGRYVPIITDGGMSFVSPFTAAAGLFQNIAHRLRCRPQRSAHRRDACLPVMAAV